MRRSREEIREYNRRYWIENKDRIKEKRDKVKNTEYMRGWRERNREKYDAYQREYRKKRKAIQESAKQSQTQERRLTK